MPLIFKPITISMWGVGGSGKTTMLAMATQAMEASGWHMNPADLESRMLIRDSRREILTGSFPPLTDAANQEPRTHKFTFSKEEHWPRSGQQQFTVVVPDYPGEFADLTVQDQHDIFNTIAGSAGILLLVDTVKPSDKSLQLWQAEFELQLENALNELVILSNTTKPNLPHVVAVCLMKVDQHFKGPDDKRWDQPEEFASQHMGKGTVRQIDRFCDRKRTNWFCCSAVGFTKDKKSQFYLDEAGFGHIYHPLDLEPIGLAEPFVWMFKELAKQAKP